MVTNGKKEERGSLSKKRRQGGKKEEEGENVSDSTVRNQRWLVWAVWAEPEVT